MKQENKLKDSFLTFFHNLFDLMVVNWLWLFCSLPVITAGPATCGLYAVTLKLARQEPVNPVKDFFSGLKSNLKPGLLLGLCAAVLLVAAAGDIWLLLRLTGWMQGVYIAVAVMVSALCLSVVAYAFPLQVMFENSLKQQIFNAFKLAVAFPFKTLKIWLILLIPVFAALALSPLVMKMLGFLYLLAGISGPVYGASRILRDVFDHVNGSPPVEEPPISEK